MNLNCVKKGSVQPHPLLLLLLIICQLGDKLVYFFGLIIQGFFFFSDFSKHMQQIMSYSNHLQICSCGRSKIRNINICYKRGACEAADRTPPSANNAAFYAVEFIEIFVKTGGLQEKYQENCLGSSSSSWLLGSLCTVLWDL